MPRQKKPKYYTPAQPFNPELKRSLGVLALIILAAILVLSYFGLGGAAGKTLNSLLTILFGQSRLIVPALLLLLGVLTEIQKDSPYESAHAAAFFLSLLGITGLLHINIPIPRSYAAVLQGQGGGLFGFAASYALVYLFGWYAAMIILITLIIVSCLLFFNTSLGRLLQAQKIFFLKLGGVGKIFFNVLQLFAASSPRLDYEPEPLQNSDFRIQISELKTQETEKKEELSKIEKEVIEDDLTNQQPTTYNLQPTTYARGLPALSLLMTVKSQPNAGDIKANQLTIQKTLANFGIPVEMGEVRVGPTITQYSLRPAEGVKLSRLTALTNDLALALAAHPIRLEAPIPGKSLVGIEVPNQRVALVTLRELLDSAEFQDLKNRGELGVALGKDVAGKPWFANLAALPHLLVAGATGSGKTVCLNTIILSLLFQHTPETLRLILIDPKRVELPLYNGIPHLLTPVVTDVTKTINALRWTIGEMERRFEILSKSGRRDIHSYNRLMETKMPYLVFVIDELADLMVAAGAEIEAGVIRLAQMARAVGIHLVLATQRPSVDVITGLIKANIPARLAFSVASLMDSRTILDAAGAEKLLGRGDLLWSGPDMSVPKRLQGAFVSEEEIKKVVDFFKGDEPPHYLDEVTAKQQPMFAFTDTPEGDDPLLTEAKEVILQAGKASASLLQRRLKVGYARAARLLDLLEAAGLIGPGDGAKPREILRSIEETDIIDDRLTEKDDLSKESENHEL